MKNALLMVNSDFYKTLMLIRYSCVAMLWNFKCESSLHFCQQHHVNTCLEFIKVSHIMDSKHSISHSQCKIFKYLILQIHIWLYIYIAFQISSLNSMIQCSFVLIHVRLLGESLQISQRSYHHKIKYNIQVIANLSLAYLYPQSINT